MILLAVLFSLLSLVKVTAQEEHTKLKIVYFYENACGSCNPEGEFIELYNELIGTEKEGVDVELLMYNTFHKSGRDEVEKYFKEYGVPEDKQFVPVVFIGDSYLIGENDIKEKLKEAFISAKEKFIMYKTEEISNERTEEQEHVQSRFLEEGSESRIENLVVYFYVTACGECQEVDKYLNAMGDGYLLGSANDDKIKFNIMRFNIAEPENLELLNKYFQAYEVPEEDQLVPIVFIGNTYLSGANDIKQMLEAQIKNGNGLTTLYLVSDNQQIDLKIDDLSGYRVLGVMVTGLINGLNPCSISMLLFFLSMLLVREVNVLKMGLSFIAGKFITYFLLGTLLFHLFAQLDVPWFQTIIKVIMLVFIFIIIILNIQDYIAAKNEKYDKIKLQLPVILRKYNHRWIEKFTAVKNGRLLMPISFVLGSFISVGEFLCTGQIYLATIIYVLQNSKALKLQAMIYFLIYGIAFVTPLLLVTVLIYKGREVFELSEFFRDKMHIVKLINAIVFVIFGIVVLLWY